MHMTARKVSDRGLLTLVRHEGIVPGPYLDVKQVWTFGIGHTAAAGSPDPAGMPRGMPADLDTEIREAFRVFRTDLSRYEAEVLRVVTVPLAPHEFDALVSFHYNTGGIARAALTRHLNAGDRAAAAQAFMGWLKPAAIRPRREAERDLFRHGRYPVGTIPVWAVDRTGRVDFSRPIRRLTEDEALALLRPAAPVASITPDAPTGWLARLAAFYFTLIRRPDPMRYVRPTSLTWWAGLLAMFTGIASVALPATGPLGELSRLVALLAGSGDASPAGLMFLGLGLIGLRDRIERGFRGDG